jgi:hypothetical protein
MYKINEILHKQYLTFTEQMADRTGLVGYPYTNAVINAAIEAGILEVAKEEIDAMKPNQVLDMFNDLTKQISAAVNPDVKN